MSEIARCPCCGHEVVPGRIYVDLDSNIISDGWHPVRLFPKTAEVAKILADHRGVTATFDTLIQGVWGNDEPDSARKALQVYVCKLRKIPWVKIETLHKRGYRMRVA
jgi:DNA-binding response OmpR family regulator